MQNSIFTLKHSAFLLTAILVYFCTNPPTFASTKSEAKRVAVIVKPTRDFSKPEAYELRPAGAATVSPEITWRYWSVIQSTSMRMVEVASAQNCGRMILPIPQLGWWLISTAGAAAVTPEI